MATLGSSLMVKGFVTDEKFIKGHSLREIENRLGFHKGRLSEGATIVLISYPNMNEFECRGYSQVAGHHFGKNYGANNLDWVKVKRNAMEYWQQNHIQLVKALPNIRHNYEMENDDQYPPGRGIPQWEITTALRGRVIAFFNEQSYKHNTPYGRKQYLHNHFS